MELDNLNLKSGYSFFQSLLSPATCLEIAKFNNSKALCVFDTNSMFGFQELNALAKKNNLKMLFGVQVDVTFQTLPHQVCVLAKNNQGYKNIAKLSRFVSRFDFTAIELDELIKFLPDCVLILPSLNGHPSDILCEKLNNLEVYLGLELDEHNVVVDYNTPFKKIPFNQINCLSHDDETALRVLMATMRGCNVDNITTRLAFPPLSEYEYADLYNEEQINNLVELIEMCNVDISSIKNELVEYPIPHEKNEYFRHLTYQGLKKRLNNRISEVYIKRLEFELDIITKMGFVDYFLVVWDYVKFAKLNNILTGPGRGSAASSLVSYVLGITNVDPIRYNLLFERFLNPQRITMPDIDIDFLDTRRDEIVNYIIEKYGTYRTAHVISYQTFGVKQAIRDASRAFGLSPRDIDMVAKKIPRSGEDLSLAQLYANFPAFAEFIDGRKIYTDIFNAAKRIVGLPRQLTLHPAGIVITKEEIDKLMPVYLHSENVIAVQCDMNFLEDNGLLKMDILALKNLTIIQDTLDLIKSPLNINQINIEDKKIYQLFCLGQTIGIFQFESSGMINALKTVNPTCFNDLTACIALYRPGPMEQIEEYALRKAKKKPVHYLHPNLAKVLGDTHGIIIYQEQIILILTLIAGFSLGKADIIRRAISKKDSQILEKTKNEFVEGCIKQGYQKDTAEQIFALIVKFANYGFNKAHSVAYSLISYQMAYLKYYYPKAFYCAYMNTFGGSEGNAKFYELVNEAKSRNIILRCPSLNRSGDKFIISDDNIYFPFSFIKGVGNQTLEMIINERKKRPFRHFLDFMERMTQMDLKQIELLIDAGVFDEFHTNRTTLHANLVSFREYAKLIEGTNSNQMIIDRSLCPPPNPILLESNVIDELTAEFNLLGMFISSFPLTSMRSELKQYVTIDYLQNARNGKYKLIGFVLDVRIQKTKKGDMMAFIKIADESGMLELLLFANNYHQMINNIYRHDFIEFEVFHSDRNTINNAKPWRRGN